MARSLGGSRGAQPKHHSGHARGVSPCRASLASSALRARPKTQAAQRLHAVGCLRMPVIVDCESCHTRFRLDEARIPASGAKVRCSKCKAAFVVKRPSATRDELIDEVVAEATDPGSSPAPGPSEDLFEKSASGTHMLGTPGESERAETASDEKWEFDEPPPPPSASSQRPAAAAADVPRVAASEPEDLDSLGSPEGWDFLAGTRKLAEEARFEAPAPEAARAHSSPRRVAPVSDAARAVDSVDTLAAAAAEAPPAKTAPKGPWAKATHDAAQTLIDSGMWLASIALCSAGLWLALAPGGQALGGAWDPVRATLAGQPVEVALRQVESGVGGTLTVVRGQLPSVPGGPVPQRVRATWLDTQGQPIPGASAIVGPALAERELRELSLARVRALHEARSGELARGGSFEAAFGALPESARALALRREAAPISPPAATQGQVEPAETVTASSRPTARPSSE